jgi:hypothetical protein
MAKTLIQARTAVRSFLDETTQSDWNDSELNTYINSRYHEIFTKVIGVFEDYYLTTTTFATIANQQEYGSTDGAPTSVYKIRRVELNYDVSNTGGSPTRCLPIPNFDSIRRDLGQVNSSTGIGASNSAGYYSYGFGSNFKIGFVPIPDKDGSSAIKLWYIQQVSDLTADSSVFNIPYVDRYWLLIAKGATADALRQGQQDRKEVDNLESYFNAGLEKMEEELSGRIAEESKGVMDVSGEYLDFGNYNY